MIHSYLFGADTDALTYGIAIAIIIAFAVYILLMISIKIRKVVVERRRRAEEATAIKKSSNWQEMDFAERLSTLSEEEQLLYSKAQSLLEEKFRKYFTKICEIYFKGEGMVARLIVNRSAIRVYLALDPKKLDASLIHDVSDEISYEQMPTLLILREERHLNYLKELIKYL